MTGDESYHASCFTCRACSKRIEELVFAKTSQGIYCMSCHNERVARSRRHAEAKKRAKEKEEKKEKEKEKAKAQHQQQQQLQQLQQQSRPSQQQRQQQRWLGPSGNDSSLTSTRSTNDLKSIASSPSRIDHSTTTDSLNVAGGNPNNIPYPQQHISASTSHDSSVFSSSPSKPVDTKNSSGLHSPIGTPAFGGYYDRSNHSGGQLSPRFTDHSKSLGSNNASPSSGPVQYLISPSPQDRRQGNNGRENESPTGNSDDGSFRTANEFGVGKTDSSSRSSSPRMTGPTVTPGLDGSNAGLGVGPVSGLEVPTTPGTSRGAKRRSINPNLVLNYNNYNPESSSSSSSSPPASSVPISPNPQPIDALTHGRASTLPPSPLRSYFTDNRDKDRATGSPTRRTHVPQQQQQQQPPPLVQPLKLGQTKMSIDRDEGGWMGANRLNANGAGLNHRLLNDNSKNGRHPGTLDSADSSAKMDKSANAPRLEPPELLSLNFSLSDPDFAVLLAESTRISSPEKKTDRDLDKAPVTAVSNGSEGTTRAVHPGTRSEPPTSHSTSQSLLVPTSPSPSPRGTAPKSAAIAAGNRKRSTSDLVLRNEEVENPQHTSRSLDLQHHGRESPLNGNMPSSSREHFRDDSHKVMNLLLTTMDRARPDPQGKAPIEFTTLQQLVHYIGSLREDVADLQIKYSRAKRTSQHSIEGLSVAAEVYEKEVAARLEAEAEVVRLRACVHGQTARLSVFAGDEKRRDSLRRQSQDLALNMTGLEKDMTKLKVERDLTMAEIRELADSAQ